MTAREPEAGLELLPVLARNVGGRRSDQSGLEKVNACLAVGLAAHGWQLRSPIARRSP